MKTLSNLFLAVAMLFAMLEIGQAQFANHVVISEVYGGGGNSGATYKNDYIELYNPTSSPIDLTGWSVQYASASGSTWDVTNLSGTIPSHGFYLVQEAQGAGGSVNLPTPDAIGIIAMASTQGKAALVNTTTALTGTNPTDASIIDKVGYGGANGYEGSGPTSALSNTTSAERKAQSSSTASSMAAGGSDANNGNGWDSNNNNSDFVIQSTQVPQNSSSPIEIPPAVGNQPPLITSVARVTFVPPVGGTDTVKANITDADGIVVSAKLHARINVGAYDSSLSMTVQSGTTWFAIIPATKHVKNGDLVEYFVSATDDSSKYSSSESTLQGYFVGDSRIDSIKSHAGASIVGYGARVNGTINSRTNTFSNGSGFIQNSSGGLKMYMIGMPILEAGRNAKVEGTITVYDGAYELTTPKFSFVDTSLGTTVITPVTITLPVSQSPSYFNEGKVVKIVGIKTDSTGTFASGKNYIYREVDNDTVTVRVESNGSANTLVGRTISSTPIDVVGVLTFYNTFMEVKPRNAVDMGFSAADGSGTASITPNVRTQSSIAVAETLTVTGDGVNTIVGVSVTIPSIWTWTDTSSRSISGVGFSGATSYVSGNGSSGNPYVITINSASVTNVNTGVLRISNLNTPSATGVTIFATKTRGASGSLASIVSSPTVNITTSNLFEAIASGNWHTPGIWTGGIVPGSSDNVSMATPNTIVTIDADAVCNNLTLTGADTAGGALGPLLQFASSGAITLTVNGRLDLSGGYGGGGGSRGGRPKLASNGNASATLVAKDYVFTNVSNTGANGDAGLNMNEGTVKFLGTTSDTLKTGAGLRLANLVIGDGITAKTILWHQTSSATMNARSLTIKSGSSFICGGTSVTSTNSIGNSSTSGLPMLAGGVTIENGASFTVNNTSGGFNSGTINIKNGGLTNNGILNLKSANGSRKYNIAFGGFTADTTASKQIISGSTAGYYANVSIGGKDSLMLYRRMILDTLWISGTLVETAGNVAVGTAVASRYVDRSIGNNFGGIGLTLNPSDTTLGATTVNRVTGYSKSGGSYSSILRYYVIYPTVLANLNATLDFYFDNSELNGQNASTLQLWKSTDDGFNWTQLNNTVDTSLRRLHATGVNSPSPRISLTASDSAHPLGGMMRQFFVNQGWCMISLPLTVVDYCKSVLYPNAISSAFAYAGGYGYFTCDTMKNAIGFWLKFPAGETLQIKGVERLLDTVSVDQGWNMIGSICQPIPTSSIQEIPSGIVLSSFYKYNGSYAVTDTIFPGNAYWVKVKSTGKLVLKASGIMKK